MNRLAKWMMRLYPARWRRRYGDELDALLAETGVDGRIVADLMKGGVRMQFSTWSFAKLAVVLSVAGLLLGAAGSFLITPIYVSQATLEMTSAPASTTRLPNRTSLAQIINDPRLDLYREQRKMEPLEDVIEEMRNDIHFDFLPAAGAQGKSMVMRISFRYPDPAKAQQVTAILVRKLVDDSFHARVDPEAGKHLLAVVDPPSLPVIPASLRRRTAELIGLLLGASIPVAWRILRRKKVARWGVAVLMLALGLAGTIAADLAYDPWYDGGRNLLGLDYRSTGTMFVQNGSPEQIQAIATDATSRTALAMIINDPRLDLYKDQKKAQPPEDVIRNMQQHLAITPTGQYFTIAFEYPDRYKAQQSVGAIMSHLSESYRRISANLPDAPMQSALATIKLTEVASTPVRPISPNRYVIAMQGGLAGLVLAALIAAIRRRWNPEPELPVDAVNG